MKEILATSEDGVLRVTINRPEKRNALSRDVLKAMGELFSAYSSDASLRAAILSGAGEDCFAAGGDLRDLASVRSESDAIEMARLGRWALNQIRQFPVPVVAALNGSALGGGAELAMACDYRVALQHVKLGFIQRRLNISTAWGGGVDLIGRLGPSCGLRLLCRGDAMAVDEAHALGLIDAIAGSGETLDEAVQNFIADITANVPQVVRAFKAVACARRRGLPNDELGEIETQKFAKAWIHEDHWKVADDIRAKGRKAQ